MGVYKPVSPSKANATGEVVGGKSATVISARAPAYHTASLTDNNKELERLRSAHAQANWRRLQVAFERAKLRTEHELSQELHTQEVKELERNYNECKNENEELMSDAQMLLDENEQMLDDIKNLRKERRTLKAKCKDLEEQLESATHKIEELRLRQKKVVCNEDKTITVKGDAKSGNSGKGGTESSSSTTKQEHNKRHSSHQTPVKASNPLLAVLKNDEARKASQQQKFQSDECSRLGETSTVVNHQSDWTKEDYEMALEVVKAQMTRARNDWSNEKEFLQKQLQEKTKENQSLDLLARDTLKENKQLKQEVKRLDRRSNKIPMQAQQPKRHVMDSSLHSSASFSLEGLMASCPRRASRSHSQSQPIGMKGRMSFVMGGGGGGGGRMRRRSGQCSQEQQEKANGRRRQSFFRKSAEDLTMVTIDSSKALGNQAGSQTGKNNSAPELESMLDHNMLMELRELAEEKHSSEEIDNSSKGPSSLVSAGSSNWTDSKVSAATRNCHESIEPSSHRSSTNLSPEELLTLSMAGATIKDGAEKSNTSDVVFENGGAGKNAQSNCTSDEDEDADHKLDSQIDGRRRSTLIRLRSTELKRRTSISELAESVMASRRTMDVANLKDEDEPADYELSSPSQMIAATTRPSSSNPYADDDDDNDSSGHARSADSAYAAHSPVATLYETSTFSDMMDSGDSSTMMRSFMNESIADTATTDAGPEESHPKISNDQYIEYSSDFDPERSDYAPADSDGERPPVAHIYGQKVPSKRYSDSLTTNGDESLGVGVDNNVTHNDHEKKGRRGPGFMWLRRNQNKQRANRKQMAARFA